MPSSPKESISPWSHDAPRGQGSHDGAIGRVTGVRWGHMNEIT